METKKIIVDCIDIEDAYIIPKNLIPILKEYYDNNDIQIFEEKMVKKIKKINDVEIKENCINLIKHLKSAKFFKWNCSFYIK